MAGFQLIASGTDKLVIPEVQLQNLIYDSCGVRVLGEAKDGGYKIEDEAGFTYTATKKDGGKVNIVRSSREIL